MDQALLHSWMMKIKPFCKVCDYRVGVLKTHGFLTNEKFVGVTSILDSMRKLQKNRKQKKK
jgi:hypothetical protein